jgi:glycosyltransferase involved in cell wall biosynthesis
MGEEKVRAGLGERLGKVKVKVCVVSGYPPGVGRGAEQIYNLVEELRHYSQLHVTVLANRVTGAPPIETTKSLTVMRVWSPNGWSSIFTTIYQLIRLKPDIILILHAHLYYGGATFTAAFTSLLLLAAKVLRKKGLIWMEHVYPLDNVTGATMKRYHVGGSPLMLRFGLLGYTRLAGMLASQILVQTEVDLQTLKQYYKVRNAASLLIGMKGKRIAREKAKRLLGLDNQRVILLFGFISPYKGVEYAIKALPGVAQAFPDSVLLIAGSIHPRFSEAGVTAEPLKLLAREVGVERNVIFKDFYIPPTEHYLYYSAADIAVLPYLSSLGPSAVMMEAFLHHTPVVASDVDFLREDVLNEETGLLVPPGDSEALAQAVIRLLGDGELYQEISQNIQTIADRYDVEDVARRLKDLYLGL